MTRKAKAAATAKPAASKPPKPTRAELAEYFDVDQQRIDHNRQAADIKRLQDETEKKVLAYVQAHSGPERCVLLYGYRLSIELANERVEWKTELLDALAKEVGKTKAAKIATRILSAAGKKQVPKIEPPASAAGPKAKPPPGLLFER